MQRKRLVLIAVAICFARLSARQDDAKAQEVMANARKAIGGKRLDAVKSLSLQAGAQRNVGNFQMNSDVELLMDLPDKYLKSEASTGGPMNMTNVSGFNGDRPIKSSGPGGIASGGAMIIRMGPGPGGPVTNNEKPTPEQQQQIDRQLVRGARQEISRLMLGWFATAHPATAAHYTYAGEADSPDGKAYVVDVKNADGFTARLFVGEQTGLPLMLTYQGPQPRMITSTGPRRDVQRELEDLQNQPPAMVEYALYFDDWRDVDGIKFPHAFRRAMAGTTMEEWTITKVKINPKIDPKKFEPAQ